MSRWRPAQRSAALRADDLVLLDAAADARERAYAPYSGFAVGAAVRTGSGEIVGGCNVENAAYPATICAERVALTAAVAAGHRDPVAVAVVGSGPGATTPCGVCRQVLNELGPTMRVLAAGGDGIVVASSLEALLPHAFGPARLAAGGGWGEHDAG